VGAGDDVQAHAILDLLPALVDKSLVLAEHQPGAARYRLLETIRQYARERLDEAGEVAQTRDRHLAYFLRLVEGSEAKLRGPEARVVMRQLAQEDDNLRLAIERALETVNGDAALRLTGALGWYWWGRDYHTEGRRWLTRALASSSQRTAPRVKALHAAGWLAHHQRDAHEARTLLQESLATARSLDDRWGAASALHALGRVAYYENDPKSARSLAEESLALAEAIGDEWLMAWAIHLLGLAAYLENDFPQARAHYERSLSIRRGLGYEEGIAILLGLLGLVAVREGDLSEARGRFGDALVIMHGLLEPWQLAMIFSAFTMIAAAEGQPLRAVRLGAAVSRLREVYDTPLIPVLEPLLVEGLALAATQLQKPEYAQAWSEGRAFSIEQTVAEALAVEVRPPAIRPPHEVSGHSAFGALSATELRVLRLLAAGRTTKEIAAELVVGVSTIDRHITHIYQKLGVRNRAEATAVALDRGLGRGKSLTSTDTAR
jgi:DNA-binding CsgD family transcriptional regulator/tetratricopeptide (TPR) repeat protein